MKPLKESQTEHCKAGQLNRVMASLDAALPAASTEYTGKYQPMGLHIAEILHERMDIGDRLAKSAALRHPND